MSGRPKTTGRFDTRAELVERVKFLYYNTELSSAAIGRNCRVSFATVNSILESTEWLNLTSDDYVPHRVIADDLVEVHIDQRELTCCGSGYDLPLYPLHVSDQVKRELDLI